MPTLTQIAKDGVVRNYREEVDNGVSGAAKNIDWTLGANQKLTLSADAVLTFTLAPGIGRVTLKLVQDATPRTVTWPGTISWPGGSAPDISTASATYYIDFYWDGTGFFGVVSSNSEGVGIFTRVGVGINPSYPLHVIEAGNTIKARFSNNTTQTLDIGTEAGGVYLDNPNTGDMVFKIGTSNVFSLFGVGGANLATSLVVTSTTVPSISAESNDQTVSSGDGVVRISSGSAFAIDKGGSIVLRGIYNAANTRIAFAAVAGRKENGTDGNSDGYLQFATRKNGVGIAEQMRIDSSGFVGIATASPSYRLDISQGGTNIVIGANTGSTTRSDTTDKFGNIACVHYTNAEEPMALISGYSSTSVNLIYLGASSGSGSLNAATYISMHTTPTTTSVSSVERIGIDNNGLVNFSNTTEATAPGTASVTFNGGVGIAKSIDMSGGILVGAATGGLKGNGTINVSVDIYKNNSAYGNPDYVFEKHFTGKIEKFKGNPGAKAYKGMLSLSDLREFVKTKHHLPGAHGIKGMFERSDFVLQYIEELHLRIFELNDRIEQLEAA